MKRPWLYHSVIYILFSALIAGCSSSNKKATLHYYVALDGNDADSGTEEAPFQTFNKAKEAAKKQQNTNQDTIKIILDEGVYYIDEALVFTADETGGAPYVIEAKKGNDVTLSGGKPLKNMSWEKYNDHIWKTSIEDVDSIPALYTESKRLTPARYPNYEEGVYPFGGFAEDAISPERVRGWSNPEGGFIHAMHESRWGGMHYKIMDKTNHDSLNYKGGWQNNRPSAMHLKQRYVSHIFEELDAPGEWYFDKNKSELYYYPHKDENPEEMNFIAAQVEQLIQLKGSVDKPVKDVQIKGLSFKHTAPTFMKTKEPLMRSDWRIYRNGAILLQGAKNSTIENNNFQLLGGNAIFVDGFNENNIITGNLIEQIGGSAISFVGKSDAVRSPSFSYGEYVPMDELDTVAGPQTEDYPSEGLVYDNLIRDIGVIEKQVAGVEIQMASKIKVKHNTIYRVPRAGINIGDGAWGGHVLEQNDVFETVLETGDHGAFNAWGRDRFWHPNRQVMDSLVAAQPKWVFLDAQNPTVIRNNRFRCDHGWDIDLDDGASNYKIYNNLTLRGGIKLREGFKRAVYNNIVINNGFHPHVWFDNSGDIFKNNILMTAHQPIGMDYWGKTVDDNIFTSKTDLEESRQFGVDSNSISIKPHFNNPEEGDFSIKKDSILKDVDFQNFDLSTVGVVSKRLKEKADTPNIPELLLNSGEQNQEAEQEWHKAVIKPVETLGEQSATGLSALKGMLVLDLKESSLLKKGGIEENDVILSLFGKETNDIHTLKKLEIANKWKGRLVFTVWRNQKEHEIEIHL